MAAVRNRSLGDIICDNTDAISTPALVMQLDQAGQEHACNNRSSLNYEHIEEMLCSYIGWVDET